MIIITNPVNMTKDRLSPYREQVSRKCKTSIGHVQNLIPTLETKKEYVLPCRNLQLYIDLRLKIEKIHQGTNFNQSPWLRQYIKNYIQR